MRESKRRKEERKRVFQQSMVFHFASAAIKGDVSFFTVTRLEFAALERALTNHHVVRFGDNVAAAV